MLFYLSYLTQLQFEGVFEMTTLKIVRLKSRVLLFSYPFVIFSLLNIFKILEQMCGFFLNLEGLRKVFIYKYFNV